MAENPVFERATRFLSALRHCRCSGCAWVAVTAWQSAEAEPIATARGYFKIEEPLKS